ncbi:hypothetical protein HDU97_002242 [Phlyctochytrium planicorne]|nr:hypothetical protein HDU97_002242 [Phlyctochytrium planicorne]
MPQQDEEEAPWPLALGHPPSYFEGLMERAEKEARIAGLFIGLAGFAAGYGAFLYAKKIGMTINARPLNLYHAGIVTSLTGLVSSQLGTHYTYLVKHQDINGERRREAQLRAEYKKRMGL